MVRGLYTAATGMIHQRNRLDTVASNIANVNTRGFKRDMVVERAFEDELLLRMDKDGIPNSRIIGTITHGVYADKVMTEFKQGNIQETGKSTDIALLGDGFFTVMTDQGELYTRDGSFTIDSYGRLVTAEGWQVLGQNGPVYVYNDQFTVDPYGNIMLGGNYIDTLRLVNFEDPEVLQKAGDNYFINTDQVGMIPFAGEVRQGFAEGSNVDVIREMVDMMTATRAYESNQKILKMIDGTLNKTVNEVGRV